MRRLLRFTRKKKRVSFLKQRFFWYGTGFLFLLTLLFYVVVFSSWLEIKEVRVQGTKEIPVEHIVAVVESSFWQGFLGIPQNSILLVNTKELKENLLNNFSAVSKVSLKRSFPKTLLVKIEEREQIATWCRDSACFALDRQGIPFKEVTHTSEYVVFYSKGNPVLGQELIHPSLLTMLLDFTEIFVGAGEPVRFLTAAFEIGQEGQVQGISKEGFKIFLDLKEDMQWQITKLELALQEKAPREKRGDLEYIDLRFGDQVYLKYKD